MVATPHFDKVLGAGVVFDPHAFHALAGHVGHFMVEDQLIFLAGSSAMAGVRTMHARMIPLRSCVSICYSGL